MKNSRREFLQWAGIAGLNLSGNDTAVAYPPASCFPDASSGKASAAGEASQSVIGAYGPWAASLRKGKLPSLSFRREEWKDLGQWKAAARARTLERLAIPDVGPLPRVSVGKQYVYDGLQVEELEWQLPYGHPTEAILLKPAGVKTKLPGILAFHDHGGNKYFGTRKITKTGDDQHPLMKAHQQQYYSGLAWANEIARRGYVVLVSDAFPFAGRRVRLQDVPERLRKGLTDDNPEDTKNIQAYNRWAGDHEHIMAKSLFCAGTTWPGVFWAEDRKALDILCARKDVDAGRIGCAGLSGGGMRTVFMAGLDDRIRCAVCVGFMSTWRDFLLHKSFTHTWMTYVPLLPNELDFPEILGLRVPLPTLVLNDSEDGLYTLPEMQSADRILAQVYEKAGATDRYRCSFYPGEHKFDAAMQKEAFDWFDRWLKKGEG